MKISSKKVKISVSVIAVVVALTVVAIAVLPGLSQKEIKNFSYVSKKQTGEVFSDEFTTSIKRNDGVTLSVNDKTGAVAIVAEDGSAVFNSRSFDAAEHLLASALSLRLRDGDGNSYSMNSTDNSVDFGTFKISKKSNSIILTFNMFSDKTEAEKGIGKAKVYAEVTLNLSCERNSFKVAVDIASIKLPESFYVEKISLLPGLFSVNDASGKEFYTLPDGSGAVIDLSTTSSEALVLDMGMYGSDVAFYEYSQGAVLPFFAMTKENSIVNTIITDGDALSELTCKRFKDGGGYLYNTFTITACGMLKGKLCVGESYNGVVSQTYSVINRGDREGYNYIAAELRDNLIKRGYLPEKISGKFMDYPFLINVLGSADGKKSSTTFEDAAEITALLKSRGVRNIALRFSGAGKRGLSTTGNQNYTFDSDLGGIEGYNKMVDSINRQKNSSWLDVNICTDKARGKGLSVKPYDSQSKFAGFGSPTANICSYDKVTGNISDCYNLISSLKSADVCINDASMFLYTDLEGGYNRQQMLDNIRKDIGSLSVKGDLMLSCPAIYLMSEADAVFSVPEKANCDDFGGVTSVPILQMVLHGSLVYGGDYINLTNLSSEDAILRVIEYGSAPSFLFTHSVNSNLNYNIYTSQTAQLYSTTKKMLPVMDMSITSHEFVIPGVYKITYDYSKVVYVNYNPSVVEVNGILVSAKDFVII